jgi:hypothetical protein
MKEFKGTPGIWMASGLDVETEDFYVCNVGDYRLDERFSLEDAEIISVANTNLITAAPDLLNALQNVLNEFDKHGEFIEWDSARSAIAKALGEIK